MFFSFNKINMEKETNFIRLKFTRDLFSGIQLFIGVLIASVGLKAFLIPNNFLDGGVTGIAILLHHITAISTSTWLIVVSVPFLILAYFFLSRKIFWKSTLSILALALIMNVETFPFITDDKILIAFFGGGLIGLGIGIAIKNEAVLDSGELIGIFLNEKFGVSIGRVILIFNVIPFATASYYLPTENILYSCLTFFVAARVIDLVVAGFDDFIGVMIVSQHSEEIQERIKNKMGVGMTVIPGTNGIGKSGKNKTSQVIKTIINRIDIRKLEEIIYDVDQEAFVAEYNVKKVSGGIIRRLFN